MVGATQRRAPIRTAFFFDPVGGVYSAFLRLRDSGTTTPDSGGFRA